MSIRFMAAALVFAIAGGGSLMQAQTAKGMAPFSMNHRRAALFHSPVDVSFLLDAPAGKHGFVRIKDGHLATGNGRRIRFWGVNITDWSKGSGLHPGHVQLGRFGRNRTNIWNYPCINTPSRQGEEGNLLALHPTVKPVALVADALLDCSAPGNLVFDSFLGSGSPLIAAHRIGRVCHGIEIDPLYIDTAIRRWQRYTGSGAIHAETGTRFEQSEAAHGV